MRRGGVLPEQGHLTGVPLLLARLGLAEGGGERRHELGAVAPPASEAQAPAAISASIPRLLQRRRSMRSHRSTRERYGPPAVRPAMMDSIPRAPTLLLAPGPKRSRRSPTTVNLNPDSLTSGASTSRPSSRASLM